MKNHLQNEVSPYLLQHVENPVDWYPWGPEAFQKARAEDKPVFLSIGYSTCHWCHVMARESFQDEEIARLLNEYFVSIKVDREERPDVDSVYMSVCQAFTGNGGWPTSIFLTPQQEPFFAGTYFPPRTGRGMVGFRELLTAIHTQWETDRDSLLASAAQVLAHLQPRNSAAGEIGSGLPDRAREQLIQSFDAQYGGFGAAPKFPTPHNLLFLLELYETRGDDQALHMVEKTLEQMYRGGIFDHVGGGFARYSTDRYFLAPHFEKMLYDNALLILAYAKAWSLTGKPMFRTAAERTAGYVLREMTGPEGGFFSAQDADSAGVEGGYYLFGYDELLRVLGEEQGQSFCRRYGVTERGNFQGKNILNLLGSEAGDAGMESCLAALYAYRRERAALHLDDKVLTAWNALMAGALATLYRAVGEKKYLHAARWAMAFLDEKLRDGEQLYVRWRDGQRGSRGFLDDYAWYIFAQISLYQAEGEPARLAAAETLCRAAVEQFQDGDKGGFLLSGRANETLVLSPKETYDGAMPSGNAVMAWCLVRLSQLTEAPEFAELARQQLAFLSAQAEPYPSGHCFFLLALSLWENPPEMITVVAAPGADRQAIRAQAGLRADLRILDEPGEGYTRLDGETTWYLCQNGTCLPPVKTRQDAAAVFARSGKNGAGAR